MNFGRELVGLADDLHVSGRMIGPDVLDQVANLDVLTHSLRILLAFLKDRFPKL
jgi:hypothetical protein